MSWMKNLDDNLEIGSIKSIPKTHNSCAVNPLKTIMKIVLHANSNLYKMLA